MQPLRSVAVLVSTARLHVMQRTVLSRQGRIYSQQGPVQKKMWGPSTGATDPIFCGKHWPIFLVITVRVQFLQFSSKTGDLFWLISLLSLGARPFSPACKKFLLWGPFLWGPLFGRTCWTCPFPLLCQGLSVCPSVCLCVNCIVTKQRNLCLHSYTTWKIIHPNFLTRIMVGEGNPFYLKHWGNWPRYWSENTDFQSIFARSASAVTCINSYLTEISVFLCVLNIGYSTV